jgi:hypothetical protein
MPLVGFEPTISADERPQTYVKQKEYNLRYLLAKIRIT